MFMRSLALWKAMGGVAMLVLAAGCGSSDDDPSPDPAPTGSVTWCEVRDVLSDKCQECHVGEGLNGAPFALETYADTQVESDSAATRRWESMQRMVEEDKMPPRDPKLTADEKELLLTWFSEGAKAVGGTDCE